MTTRRSFLRNLVVAIVLAPVVAPVVAKFAEVMPVKYPWVISVDEAMAEFWQCQFESASKPLHPEFGYAFIVKRAPDGTPLFTA